MIRYSDLPADPADAAAVDAYCQWCADVGCDDPDETLTLVGYLLRRPDHAAAVRAFLAREQAARAQLDPRGGPARK